MDKNSKEESRGIVGRSVSTILLTAGLLWVGYLMSGHVDSFVDVLPGSWLGFLGSLLLLALSLALPGMVFHLLLKSHLEKGNSKVNSLNLYFAGQLLKYVPGKIWGIVYQISRSSSDVSAGTITRVNIDHTVVVMSVNIIFATCLLAVKSLVPFLWAVIAVAGVSLASGVYIFGGVDRLLGFMSSLLSKNKRKYLDALRTSPMKLDLLVKILSVQVTSMVLFTGAWVSLANGYPQLFDVDFVGLGMMYVIAAAIGILTMITPAGLGVREASFVTLAVGLASAHELAFVAILARVWFLVAEVFTAGAMLFFGFLISSFGTHETS